MPGALGFEGRDDRFKAKFPMYISTPSGKPLKIKNKQQLKDQLDKTEKKYEALAKKANKTAEDQKNLIILNDDKLFLNQKYKEIEGREEIQDPNQADQRIEFPLNVQVPSGNVYELQSFEDFNKLEDKERLEQEFNARLGSTFNRKSKEQIAKELEADLLAIRKEKEKALSQGWVDTKTRKLYYPDGTEIPTTEEGVNEYNAQDFLQKERQKLDTVFEGQLQKKKFLLNQAKIALEKGDEYASKIYQEEANEEQRALEATRARQRYLENIGGGQSDYTLTEHNIKKRQEQLLKELENIYPKSKQEIAATPPQATAAPQEILSGQEAPVQETGIQHRVDEAGNVINTERNTPVDQEKLRLAKIQEEASRIANLPFAENPYATIAPMNRYEEEGAKNLGRLAVEELNKGQNIFPLKIKDPLTQEEYTLNNKKEYDETIDTYKKEKEKSLAVNNPQLAEMLQNQIDHIQGAYQSTVVHNQAQQQKEKFQFPEPQHEEVVERYMYPRENEASERYREAMERYMNPDYMRSEYKTLKDELVGELRHKAMRRFNESLKDLNWQHIASKMGRSGFFDQQRQKMFENVQNELNLQDKELGLQLYGRYVQDAGNRAKEAREGLNQSQQQEASRALVALRKDEIERAKALDAYKVNKLEEEGRRERQKQAALDLIGLGRSKREHAQQGLNVQSAEFMRKQGYPQERLNTYADTLRRATLGQPQANVPEREQIFEPRMIPLPEPAMRAREIEGGRNTLPVEPTPKPESTTFRDLAGLALGGANLALQYSQYKDQKAANEAARNQPQATAK